MSKKGHINRKKKPDSTKKSQIQEKYTTTLSNTHYRLHSIFKRQYMHIQNKAHSTAKRFKNFVLA